MTNDKQRERLVELMYKANEIFAECECTDEEAVEKLADYLITNGAIVPPDELFSIVDKGTIYASVSKAIVDWLPLYVIKSPEKYGYYRTREEAEQALRKEDKGK